MELLITISCVTFAVFVGANILYPVFCRKGSMHPLEALPVAYCLGVGAISLEMFLLYILDIGFNPATIIAPWLILLCVNVMLMIKPASVDAPVFAPSLAQRGKVNMLTAVLSAGVIFEISFAFFRALIKPIESYDAIAIYAIKSKIFFLAKGIPHDFFTKIAGAFPHPDYPLNIPLFESFIYLSLGSLNDQLAKVIFPIFFVAILSIFYFAVRRFAGVNYALLFTFLLAGIPQFNVYATNAYIDLPLAAYCFISAYYLFEWLKEKTRRDLLIVSAVMAALAGWTKNEGLMYCASYLAVIFVSLVIEGKRGFAKNAFGLLLYAAIIVLILAPWLYIKRACHLVTTDIGEVKIDPVFLFKQLHKLTAVVYEFQKQALGPKKWNIFWLVAIAGFILNFRKAFTPAYRYITASLVIIVCGYIYFYLIAPIDVTFFLSKTWSRFLIQFLPIAAYWLAALLKEDVDV